MSFPESTFDNLLLLQIKIMTDKICSEFGSDRQQEVVLQILRIHM